MALHATGQVFQAVVASRLDLPQPISHWDHDAVIQTEQTPLIKPCRKCRSIERKTGEFRASGGFLSSFFDFATERFTFVSCGQCGYTEFYNSKLGSGIRIVDFLGD
jgi:uncharacterized protein